MSLYDDYDPAQPLRMPIDRLYRNAREPFSGRTFIFAGITSGGTGDVFNLLLLNLMTGESCYHQTSREGLKEFHRVEQGGLSAAERRALESRSRGYAEMCAAFAALTRDPDAGKGLEHFTDSGSDY